MNCGRARQNGLDITRSIPRVTGPAPSRARSFLLGDGPVSAREELGLPPWIVQSVCPPLEVFAMQLNQIAERLGVPRLSRESKFAAINPSLDLKRPFLGVLSTAECLVDIFSFSPNLGTPGTGIELRECRQSVCAPCAPSRRTAAKRSHDSVEKSAHDPVQRIETTENMRPYQSFRFSVAPMMDWTDRRCRAFHRLMTRRARLYTEMVTADAVVFGAARAPDRLRPGRASGRAAAGRRRTRAGSQKRRDRRRFRLRRNQPQCGCPSDRVQSGRSARA